MLRLLASILAMIAVGSAGTVRADTWAVVPLGIGEEPSRARAVADTSAATLETSGATVFQSAQLTHRIENEVSLEFAPAPADLIERLDRAESDLAVAVAERRYGEVLTHTRALFDAVRPHVAAVHRDENASADLSNVCGYRVRAAHAADGSGARAAIECFELVPRFSPDPGRHLPETLQLLTGVSNQLPAAIQVEASPDDPPNCAVRVNGVLVGRTPSARVDVPAGIFSVQVECGVAPGRVHRVQASSGELVVHVRASLDQALRSRPAAMVYPSSSALTALPGDVAALGRAIGADHVLVAAEGPSGVVLRAFAIEPGDGPARQLREAVVGSGSDEARIRQSVVALAGSTLGDPSAGTPRQAGGASVSPVGPILLGVGGAALIAAAITGGIVMNEGDSLTAMCPTQMSCPEALKSSYDQMRSLATATDVLWVSGAGIAVTGLILTLLLGESGESPPASVACGPHGCFGTSREGTNASKRYVFDLPFRVARHGLYPDRATAYVRNPGRRRPNGCCCRRFGGSGCGHGCRSTAPNT